MRDADHPSDLRWPLLQRCSISNKQDMTTMGNCQYVTSDDRAFDQSHKIKQRKRLMTRHHNSAKTMSMASTAMSLSSESHQRDATRREENLSFQAQPVVASRPKPRLSAETSLKLIHAEEVELGCIRYSFSRLEDAKREAAASQKPILYIDFYIPGDTSIGGNILSHPLIVEAAETLFVPVQFRHDYAPVNVANQISYTTVRILDYCGDDLVKPIKDKQLTLASLASAMIGALIACDLNVPTYLTLVKEEQDARRWDGPLNCLRRIDREAIFGVQCPHQSEVHFGGLDGVISTRSGYYDGQDVCQVTYDTTRLSYCSLVRHALQQEITSIVYYRSSEERVVGIIEQTRLNAYRTELVELHEDQTIHQSVDPKHALRTTMLRFVPLTNLQSTRANRLVSLGAFNEAMHLLSPRQGHMLMRAMQNDPNTKKEAVDIPITVAWKNIFLQSTVQTSQ